MAHRPDTMISPVMPLAPKAVVIAVAEGATSPAMMAHPVVGMVNARSTVATTVKTVPHRGVAVAISSVRLMDRAARPVEGTARVVQVDRPADPVAQGDALAGLGQDAPWGVAQVWAANPNARPW